MCFKVRCNFVVLLVAKTKFGSYWMINLQVTISIFCGGVSGVVELLMSELRSKSYRLGWSEGPDMIQESF